jgi:ATP-dependent helicase HrpA
MKGIPKKGGSLITALSQFIYTRFGLDIPASAWPYHTLPNHLQMRIALTGPNGEVIHSARDSSILSRNISCDIGSEEFESARKAWEKTSITQWDFGNLPETITLSSKGGVKWTVYPGLKKVESQTPGVEQINLCLFCRRGEAITSHKQGIAALFAIHFAKDLKFLKKKLTLPSATRDRADYFGGSKRIEKKLYDRVIRDSFCRNIRTQKAFKAHAQSIAPDLFADAQKKLNRVIFLLDAYHQSRSTLYRLEQANSGNRGAINFLKNIRAELSRLVPETFVDRYDTDQMVHIERYIKALTIRAQRGVLNFEKDQARASELQPYTDKLEELLKTLSPSVSEERKKAIEAYFWLIEEYKVSLFAQELKTALPVSKKRLNQKLKEIDRMI